MDMEAGREMDALIAELMGVDLESECGGDMYNEDDNNWSCTHCPKTGEWGEDFKHTAVPRRYSTDIAAAWEVVEKLHLIIGESVGSDGSHWYCANSWDDQDATVEACADTAPLAICRAALMAVA